MVDDRSYEIGFNDGITTVTAIVVSTLVHHNIDPSEIKKRLAQEMLK